MTATGQLTRPPDATPHRARVLPHRALLLCGLVGPVLFVATFLVEGALRRGYDPWRASISALSLGPDGWIQRTSFVVFGLLTFGWSLSLAASLTPRRFARRVCVTQSLAALGLVVDGLFSQDAVLRPTSGTLLPFALSLHAKIHLAAALLTFLALPLCCFLLARRLTNEPGWRGWSLYSVTTGIAFAVLAAAFLADQLHVHGSHAGTFEKLATIVMSAYGVALSIRLLSRGGRMTVPATNAELNS